MKKITLLAAAGVGYVLGTRAGHQRYEQISAGARKVAGSPRVRAATSRATEVIAQQAPVIVEAARHRAAEAASAAADKVRNDPFTTP